MLGGWLARSAGIPTLQGDWLHFSLEGDTSATIFCKEVAFS